MKEQETETDFIRTSALCLLFGAILSSLAMAMHPMGGDINYIIKIRSVLTISHSIAIFCLPFIGFGFLGLTKVLETKSKTSTLAFFIFSFGLFAAMVAAAINGLTLPIFASSLSANDNDIATVVKIINYGKFINIAMAAIFVAGVSLSIGIWSVLIIQTSKLPKWLGYLGIAIIAFGVLGALFKNNFTNLLGFRTFILGLVSWKVAAGNCMMQKRPLQVLNSELAS